MNKQPNINELSSSGQRLVAEKIYRSNFYFFAKRAFSIVYPGETFQPNWHIETMCFELEQVIHGHNRRLIINVPPRHLKSYCAVIALPAFLLGLDPSIRIIVATYSQDLGTDHGERLRLLITSTWYKKLFPTTRMRTQNQEELRTTMGGGRRNVSPKSSTTGFGADVIIIDDLLNAADIGSDTVRRQAVQFYRDALHSRLNRQDTGRIISIQQRLREDDFPAFLLEQGGWRHLNLKAIATAPEIVSLYSQRKHVRNPGDLLFPQYQNQEVLDSIRRDVGNPAFSAQYQQEPVPPEGALLRLAALHFYENEIEREEFSGVIQSWDTAYSEEPGADFSVCTTWGYKGRCWYLIDVWRKRVAFPDLIDAVKSQKKKWQADRVVVEAIGTGLSLMQQFKHTDLNHRSWLKGFKPKGNKIDRVAEQSAQLESDAFLFPAWNPPWMEPLMQELRAFPSGRYDDQVDSITQALKYISAHRLAEGARSQPERKTPVRAPGRRLYGRRSQG